jgi:hypothetical protein
MLIDCDTCSVRGPACRDCVVTVILNNPPQPVEWDDEEQAAISSLAEAGLLPPLRLVPVKRSKPLPGVASVHTAS